MKDGRPGIKSAGLEEGAGHRVRAGEQLQRREGSFFVCIAADEDRDGGVGGREAWHAGEEGEGALGTGRRGDLCVCNLIQGYSGGLP